jgi:hypothetical protein
MRLTEYFDTVYRPLKLRGKSPATTRLYGCLVSTLARFLGRPPDLEDIADEMLLARFLEWRTTQGKSPFTIEKERQQLVALCRLANERRLIAAMPSCEPAPLPDPVPTAWSTDDLQRLYAVASSMRGLVGTVHASLWWPTLISVAFQSGERIGAIMAVPRSCYARPCLTFTALTRKGKRRGRVCDLTEDVCDAVEAVMASAKGGRESPIFVWDGAKTYLWDRLRWMLDKAGLSGRRLGFQQIRRSSISMVARAGGDAVRHAGHAQAATTRRWYIDPRFIDSGPRSCDLLPKLRSRKR